MKKLLIIIFLLILSGCSQPLGGNSVNLKVPKDRILKHKIIKSNVEYDYISAKEVPLAEENIKGKLVKEDLGKRTANSQHFKIGENKYQSKFFPGSPFYKEADKWFQVETATTTLEIWNEATKITLWEKIFKGAVADTFYAGAGDGFVQLFYCAAYADCHDATTGNNASSGVDPATVAYGYLGATYKYDIQRGFFPINTADLPNGATISAASFFAKTSGAPVGTQVYGLVQTFQADSTTLATADLEDCGSDNGNPARAKYQPVEGATRQTPATDTYVEWAMDATGISWISLTGYTNLGVRIHNDMDNHDPGTGTEPYTNFHSSEATGTDEDPYISITYTAPPSVIYNQDIIIFE